MSDFNLFYRIAILVLLFIPVAAGCGEVEQEAERQAPKETAFTYTIPDQSVTLAGQRTKTEHQAEDFAIAAAHPLATDAGYQVLRAGGSAVDAAVAVQMVLTLVEPQSSGIGGGAFLMHSDGSGIRAYDGREVAPSGVDETLFLDEKGVPLPFTEAVHSGLSVGVPGTPAMLKAAHEAHGRLSWEVLFRPAITLAEEGFAISPRLRNQLQEDQRLKEDCIAGELYYDENGGVRPEKYTLRNPALAEILRTLSKEGNTAFYEGPIAESIVDRVQSHSRPGYLTTEDLAGYPEQEFEREAICTPWRAYTVCGFPPPSSGHLTIMQILGIMEQLETPSPALAPASASASSPTPTPTPTPTPAPALTSAPTPASAQAEVVQTAEWLHHFMEASRLAYADRNRYIADPDFVEPPGGRWERLLDPAYLKERAALIKDTSMKEAKAGDPGAVTGDYGVHPKQPDHGTSHISIVDGDGNAVSMTSSIEQPFGSRLMTDGGTGLPGGFHLNNELTDFSLSPVDEEGRPVANRVEPGKRPRSSMSPTLIFDSKTGDFIASLGSPGGAAIIPYIARTILAIFDLKLNTQEAIDMPNFANVQGPVLLEEDRFPGEVIRRLDELGHDIEERQLTSGLQVIQRREEVFFGGADSRREGVVMGD